MPPPYYFYHDPFLLPHAVNEETIVRHSDTGDDDMTNMISRIPSFLFSNEGLQSVNAAAVETPKIGSEKYRKHLRRIVKLFGKELAAEFHSTIELRTAIAMQTSSVATHITRIIMTETGGSRSDQARSFDADPTVGGDLRRDVIIESSDRDEHNRSASPEYEAEIRRFMLDSDACVRFQIDLIVFVHAAYETRILEALSSNHVWEAHQDHISLPRVARELSWVPTSLLSF